MTGRRKSTATNPLPHVWLDEAGGALKSCRHCPAVRNLTAVEYRAKYGVDRPQPRPQQSGSDYLGVIAGIAVVVTVLGLILLHNLGAGAL